MERDEYRIMNHIERSYWWFVGKRFLVKSALEQLYVDGLSNGKTLDIGCGTGMIMRLLQGFGPAYGTELSWEAIRFLKQRDLELIIRSDANEALSFKDNTFSVVTCLDVLEHLDNDFSLLKEMLRVCKSGGHVIVTVPAFELLWSPHDTALHHKRRYTKQQMLEKIRHFNCTVVKCSYYNAILLLPVLVVRKLKTLLSNNKAVRSDFFIRLPAWMNRILSFLFVCEIYCLRYLNLPFGVSLLLILQKGSGFDLKTK